MRNIEKQFETPLGIIRCGINSDGFEKTFDTQKYENGNSEIFKTSGHKVEIITFKIRLPLYNDDILTDSFGCIFRIVKTADIDEKIETYCLLDKYEDVEFGIDCGEHLDAILAENNEWNLHIGTEDGEVLNWRAENENWFPARLKNNLNLENSITEMKENGFITKIPILDKNEKIHIQFLTAYDRKDEQKVNTWLAVDETKQNLENWIGIS
ncbi:hypothetical protein [Flavobacterium restrictum]|uniref:Uncharacterized protein n=1 Tax=Flavobacterium restrictum TaxID=2594428 RepID=A0A553DIT9_9FLAO|nr:hypothetical protein [Flavobacterium restrictum]TRX32585.1 hypothetical protein FNW21_16175 [Flavobacterium restrictum]